MADHGHHDPGGHELEAVNTKMLFRLFIALSVVTLLAAIAVVQWFYSQRRELEASYAAQGSFLLIDHKTKMSADLEGIDAVAQNLVAKPAMLQAPPPPPGWTHPDDLVGAGEPAAVPEESEPTQDEPAQEEPAQDEPAQDEPAQEEPAQDEPAQDEPAQDEPAQDEPAPAEAADGE